LLLLTLKRAENYSSRIKFGKNYLEMQEDMDAKPDLGTVSTKEANSNDELKFETLNTKAY
jgi:hypothetical protein